MCDRILSLSFWMLSVFQTDRQTRQKERKTKIIYPDWQCHITFLFIPWRPSRCNDLRYRNIHPNHINVKYWAVLHLFFEFLFFELRKKPPTDVFVTYSVLFRREPQFRPNKKLARVLSEIKKILRGGVDSFFKPLIIFGTFYNIVYSKFPLPSFA